VTNDHEVEVRGARLGTARLGQTANIDHRGLSGNAFQVPCAASAVTMMGWRGCGCQGWTSTGVVAPIWLTVHVQK
jgi:hypothetical protein